MFHLNEALYGKRAQPPKSRVPSSTRGSTSGLPYSLPTLEQLQSSNICIEVSRGDTQRIEPVKKLDNPIETFLPPSGPYYDFYMLNTILSKRFLDNKDKCVSCWMPYHVASPRTCSYQCGLCQTKDHLGEECHALYVPMKFWKERGHTPPATGVQIRPKAGELAYLIIAGVIKPCKRLEDPIIVDMKHPIVQAFYLGRAEPEELMKRERVPRKERRKITQEAPVASAQGLSPLAGSEAPEGSTNALITPKASTASSVPSETTKNTMRAHASQPQIRVGGNTLHLERDPRLIGRTKLPPSLLSLVDHKDCEAKVLEKEAELEQAWADNTRICEAKDRELERARGEMKEKDRRIAELEKALHNIRSVAHGPFVKMTGDKRPKLEDDVGGKRSD